MSCYTFKSRLRYNLVAMSLGIGANVIFSLIFAAGDASGWMGYMCRCVRDSVPFRVRRVVQGG